MIDPTSLTIAASRARPACWAAALLVATLAPACQPSKTAPSAKPAPVAPVAPAASPKPVAVAPVADHDPVAVVPVAVPKPAPPTPNPPAAEGEVHSDSVYQVTSSWQDQSAKPVRLRDLRGEVVVMSMVFTHCRYACPRIVADMQKIEAGLKGVAYGANVRFVLVSMDPERDTPKRLTEFAAKHKLDLTRWRLLTGPEGDVRVLSAVLGGRYKQAPNGDFAHSNLVCVLDRAGRIAHRQEGLDIAPQEALAAIAKLNPGD